MRAVAERVGPIAATSANRHGEPTAPDRRRGGRVAHRRRPTSWSTAGRSRRTASTVVDATTHAVDGAAARADRRRRSHRGRDRLTRPRTSRGERSMPSHKVDPVGDRGPRVACRCSPTCTSATSRRSPSHRRARRRRGRRRPHGPGRRGHRVLLRDRRARPACSRAASTSPTSARARSSARWRSSVTSLATRAWSRSRRCDCSPSTSSAFKKLLEEMPGVSRGHHEAPRGPSRGEPRPPVATALQQRRSRRRARCGRGGRRGPR